MITLDIVLSLLLLVGAYSGSKRGFLAELFYFLALVIGVFCGFKFIRLGVDFLHQKFNTDTVFLPYFSFFLIFILVILLVIWIGSFIKNGIDKTFLGKVDAIAGGILGMLKTAFCVSVFIWLTELVPIKIPSGWVSGSYLYPKMAEVIHVFSFFFGQILPFFKESFKHL